MTLPRGGLGSTSLGAVGGPRGVAAGGLRVLIEFISQYDPAAVKQLEADLGELQSLQDKFGERQISLTDRLTKVQEKQAKARATLLASIKNLDKAAAAQATRDLKGIEAGLGGSPRQRAQAKKDLQLFVGDLQKSGALTSAEAKLVSQLVKLETQRRSLVTQLNNAKKTGLAIDEQQVAVQGELGRFAALRQQLPQRLGGLALGALGGLVGGAIIGVGFQAAQAVIDRVGEAIQDLIDPARHARESLRDLETQVQQVADDRDISRIAAIRDILRSFGLGADNATAALLNQALATQKGNDAVKERLKLEDIINNADSLRKANLQALTESVIRQAIAEGKHVTVLHEKSGATHTLIDGVNASIIAQDQYKAILDGLIQSENEDVNAKNRQRAAAFALTLAQNALNAASAAYVSRQTAGIDRQIEGLQSAGPSARTRQLERQLERAQSGGGGSSNAAALKNLAEERQLILLRQRLRLLGTNISLERFSGKFLLEAINAKLKALQKEASAQDRLNRLLDLQLRIARGIKRESGESINDFLERRAQENRNTLSEQRDIAREAQQQELQDLQDKTQDEVALKELAEQKKTLLAQAGSDARIKALQKELDASKKADAAATAAKIKALEAQKKALEDAANNALQVASQEHLDELQNYIRMSRTINELARASGEIRGLEQAKEFLKAILASGILPPEQAAEVRRALGGIQGALNAYQRKFNFLSYGPALSNLLEKEQKYGLARGGFIPLTNASTPFGQNFQFGEQGSEAGLMVLPNRIAQAMKGQGGIGDMNFYGIPMEDKYSYAFKIRQTVREVIKEELRG